MNSWFCRPTAQGGEDAAHHETLRAEALVANCGDPIPLALTSRSQSESTRRATAMG
ncbi:hypothetical protein BN381_70111 [Candidatus Microthrix parvicella RN1]|uniref:Uncharacterized protein n=1 Tax=Candidatus Neomicrothrix parvicella RN1 TaxID=1229780 RepID=R4Z7F4_9ACTN|nr:hypothetical protein BN381_70111 [Candidatus Microthrix parvicella RN1]